MANGQGGARPGAGRRKSESISRTQELVAKAVAAGITPLEVLTEGLNFYHNLAQEAVRQFEEETNAKLKKKKFLVVREMKNYTKEYAKDAAPYIHPKLQAVTQSGPNGGPIQIGLSIEFVPATKA